MGLGYGPVVALYTALSLGGIAWKLNSAWWSTYDMDNLGLDSAEAARTLQALLQSSVVLALLGNLVVNFFLLITLSMKVHFHPIYPSSLVFQLIPFLFGSLLTKLRGMRQALVWITIMERGFSTSLSA